MQISTETLNHIHVFIKSNKRPLLTCDIAKEFHISELQALAYVNCLRKQSKIRMIIRPLSHINHHSCWYL